MWNRVLAMYFYDNRFYNFSNKKAMKRLTSWLFGSSTISIPLRKDNPPERKHL